MMFSALINTLSPSCKIVVIDDDYNTLFSGVAGDAWTLGGVYDWRDVVSVAPYINGDGAAALVVAI